MTHEDRLALARAWHEAHVANAANNAEVEDMRQALEVLGVKKEVEK